jgi:hypothetical protein
MQAGPYKMFKMCEFFAQKNMDSKFYRQIFETQRKKSFRKNAKKTMKSYCPNVSKKNARDVTHDKPLKQ